MSIFNEIPKTDAVRLTEHANSIVYESKVMHESLKSQIIQVFNMVWNAEFSPQSIIDDLGDRALPMFIVSAQLQNILKTVDPSYEKLIPPFEYSIVDGRVVVSDIPTGS